MKVAHLTTVASSLRYLLLPQLLAIRDLGGESIGISAPGEDVAFLERMGIRHVALQSSTRSMSLLSDARAARELRDVLRDERVDILHTHNPKPGVYGRVLGRLSGVPVVINTVHGLYATEGDVAAKRFLVYLLEALASRFSDAELFQSAEDLAVMRRFPLVRKKHLRLLGNGIDLVRFSPEPDGVSRCRVREEIGVGEGELVVGTVARLVAEKGIPELLDAYRQRGTDYALVVAGPFDPTKFDAISPSLVAEAERSGVRFLGHRDDVEHLYQALDLFVLPSHREGFPRAAMEAAASGLPVVATNIRGCRDVVEHGRNGLLVTVDDSTRLAHAIEEVLSDGKKRESMGVESREKAIRDFDESRVVSRVMSAYREVAEGKGLKELAGSLDRAVGAL